MDRCRILAISDVKRWTGFDAALALHAPDLVVLAGDLLYDANVDLRPARQRMPVPQRRAGTAGGSGRAGCWNDPAFLGAYLETHVQGFWDFLRNAGEQVPVLVVRGNNDRTSLGYDERRISDVPGVEEISGRVVRRCGLTIAGSAYPTGGPVAAMEALHRQARRSGRIDVLVSHDPHRNVPRLQATLAPRLIVKGHFGGGNHMVGDCPLVLTERAHHVVLDVEGDTVVSRQYILGADGSPWALLPPEEAALRPWLRPADDRMRMPP